MGAVYRALDVSTGKEVALKRILEKRSGNSRVLLRFQSEFHTMARLAHPHIVEVYDYGVDPAGPYYTMEILDGQDLRDMARPSPMEACRILRDVAVALAFLHSKRLLHRDLAPRNVRCTAAGKAKLIDFGMLSTFGVSDDVGGTPPLIPPEMLRGLPMDHRSDLYQLGGLAYWLLTGTYAYPARKITELESRWKTPPQPPRALNQDIPQALEELVVSMMCVDPLGRPRSAAEVADRLSAIGQLDPPDIDVSKGYLASAALIGRAREMERMRIRIAQSFEGKGGVVVINAPSGVGKSRLLKESALEAQLVGSTVVSASSNAASFGPYGVFREIARCLLASAPEDALEAARSDAAAIAALIPELRGPLALEIANTTDEATSDPAEERLRGQTALNRWVLRIAERRPLTFLVDDIQRCDEASLAVLVGLAHSIRTSPILLVVGMRSDERPRHPQSVASIMDAGASIKLRGLEKPETEEFVKALFGDVPRVPNLANWMHKNTGGSPLHLTELAHYVVAKGIVSYHEGLWVLPAQSVNIDVPKGLTGAIDARISLLGAKARGLGETLAMHGGNLDIELALQLSKIETADAIFGLVGELMETQVLVGTATSFRFRHDGLREALLRQLSKTQEQELHLRVATVLAATEAIPEDREAQVGWHFLRGGDRERGAELLERASRRLFAAQAMRDALAPLEAVIEHYKTQGVRSYAYLELLYMIVMAGAISERQVALRYMDETLEAYQREAGITLAIRLGKVFGRHIALFLAVATSVVRWFFTRRKSRGISPLYTLSRYLMMAAHSSYIHYATNDIEGIRKSLQWIAPMNAFKGRAPHGAYESQHGMLDLMLGRFDEGVSKFRYGVHVVLTDHITPASDFERRYIEAAGRGFAVVGGVLQLDPTIDEELERIRELDLRYFGFCARAGVALRHRLRGEEEQALAVAQELEVVGLQLGAGWHIEALLLTVSSFAYALSHDILGLKRCAEELHRLNQSGFCFGPQLALVRGEYHRERGELTLANEALDKALDLIDGEEATIRQWALAAKSEVFLALGDLDSAQDCIGRVLEFSTDPKRAQLLPRLRSTRSSALLLAQRGDLDGAEALLTKQLGEVEGLQNPVLTCMYQEALARVALLRNDTDAFEAHCIEVAHAVNPTRNPALIAISERLREPLRGSRRQGLRSTNIILDSITTVVNVTTSPPTMLDSTPTADTTAPEHSLLERVLSSCHGPAARSERALELLVLASSGKVGYLFVVRDDAPALSAPPFAEPSPALVAQIDTLLHSAANAEHREDTIVLDGERWHLTALVLAIGAHERIVGALAIREGAIRYQPPTTMLVQQIAKELYEAGDATALDTHS